MVNWTQTTRRLGAVAVAAVILMGSGVPTTEAHEVTLADPPSPALVELLGGDGDDYGFGAALAADGGVFVAGRTESPRVMGHVNAGSRDMLLAKLSRGGGVEWVRLLGGRDRDTALNVAAIADGGAILVGHTTSARLRGIRTSGNADVVVARYRADGTLQWLRLLGTRGVEVVSGAAVAGDGSVVIAGSIDPRPIVGRTYTLDADAPGSASDALFKPVVEGAVALRISAFVARYSSDGDRLFFRRYGGPGGSTFGRDVALARDGSIYLAGDTYTPELDGQANGGAVDAMLAKFDASGRHQWTRLYGFESEDEARGVALDADGFAYVAGRVENWGRYCTHLGCTRVRLNPDMLLAKYDPDGRRIWTRVLRGLKYDFLQDVAVGPGGRVYVIGLTLSTALEHQPTGVDGNGDRAITVGAYDTSGNGKWLFFAAEGNGFAVTVSKRGDLYAVGSASGGFLGQKSAGSGDIAVVKFSARALSAAGGDRP